MAIAGASLYNRDLGDWNTAQVTQMDGMFLEASIFNQNLSSWCVNLITEAPTDFSRQSALPNNFLPTWGSCPD
ncbi:MAG: BspA family leucine-rich repeat surface protein [Flavobacteriia bacterium]|nr:BspA family leucine-rich repeat surface protein [Flavobacteriia bacterium]